MHDKSNSFSSYVCLDSQRLKDTFFSSSKKKSSSRRILFFFLTTSLIMGSLGVIFFLKYEFLLIPRKTELKENSLSLFGDNISSLNLLGSNKQLIKKTRTSFIYLANLSKKGTGIRFDFNKPVNLKDNSLLLYLKEPNIPLEIKVVVRDIRFFSNSLNPLIVRINPHFKPKDDSQASYKWWNFFYRKLNNKFHLSSVKVPFDFENTLLQNTDLSRINQISFYLYSADEKEICVTERDDSKRKQVLIKDLILVKKEGK